MERHTSFSRTLYERSGSEQMLNMMEGAEHTISIYEPVLEIAMNSPSYEKLIAVIESLYYS